MDGYNKLYCKAENLLKVAVKDRKYSFQYEFEFE
jgi:hypothetical protein